MASELRFDDDVVIVTGGGRGMGRAHALELAGRGARVVVNDIAGSDTVTAEIRSAGGTAIADAHSVATERGGAALVEAALTAWGRLDAVVTNATIYRDVPFAAMSRQDFDALLDVKLRAAFFVLQPAYRAMQAGGGGRIVGVTSMSGLLGMPTQANYAAANAGLVGLIRTLALEGAELGIRANLVNPGALNATADQWADTISSIDGDVIRANFLPERVSPMVAVLAHRSCPCSGQVLGAWGGRFARSTITTSRGWIAPEPPTAEDVAAHWDEITDQSAAEDSPLNALTFARENMERLYGS